MVPVLLSHGFSRISAPSGHKRHLMLYSFPGREEQIAEVIHLLFPFREPVETKIECPRVPEKRYPGLSCLVPFGTKNQAVFERLCPELSRMCPDKVSRMS